MKAKPVRVGVQVNRGKAGARQLVCDLVAYARSNPEIEFLWEEKTARYLKDTKGYSLAALCRRKLDFLLVAGGDGSMLQTVREVYPSQIPILGVNIGSLGFLTTCAQTDLFDALPCIAQRNLTTGPRLALQGWIHRGKLKDHVPCALNDVVVSRGERSQLIRVRVRMNGALVTEYVCDGLIACTATGSTAYSVAANGPIISPEAQVMALTPICPHTLTHRSLIVGTEQRIVIEIPPQPSQVIVQFDGVSYGKLRVGDWLELQAAKHPVQLAYTPDRDFYSILREKLKWSGASV